MPSPMNVAQKLVSSHLVEGEMRSGAKIALRVDQVLLQDVLALGLPSFRCVVQQAR